MMVKLLDTSPRPVPASSTSIAVCFHRSRKLSLEAPLGNFHWVKWGKLMLNRIIDILFSRQSQMSSTRGVEVTWPRFERQNHSCERSAQAFAKICCRESVNLGLCVTTVVVSAVQVSLKECLGTNVEQCISVRRTGFFSAREKPTPQKTSRKESLAKEKNEYRI